ncbi:hypothetical protein [Flavobacterium sp. RS13.1]|uniref:hypothetical protein n=1 Tax=Flavobacterium sp. RS13.1 TaxID=3400345 RepID=UPI003AAB07B7
MIKKIIILVLFLNSLFSFSQIANDSLITSMKNAKKILLTSHEDFELFIKKTGERKTKFRPLLKNEKPNKKIIKKQIYLDLKLKNELINIISNQKKDSLVYDGNYCFEPHHTIFLYKEKKWLYIDLCFGCDHYSYSKELKINKDDFLVTYEDWRKLETFFRNQNLNYKMRKRK